MIKRSIYLELILVFFIFYNSKIFSQDLLTLKDAVEISLKNNYSINIAKNEQQISNNNSNIGNAGFLPKLDANGNYTKSISNIKQEYSNGSSIERNGSKSSNLNAGISLNWTIFDGLNMFATLSRLKELRKIGDLNFKSTVESNISDVTSTYFNIVREEQVIDVLKRTIAISNERVKIAKDKLELGSGSKFDLLQAQVDLNDDKSNLLQEELTLSQLKIKLNNYLGRNADEDFSVADTILINRDLNYKDLQELVVNQNSQLKIAEQNKNISELDLKIAQSDWFPTISLNAGYSFSRSEAEAGFFKSNQNGAFNYGVTASLNLFDGLNTSRKIQNAEISIETNELYLKQTENQVNSDLLHTFKEYQNSIELVDLETENLNAAEENVSVALEKLKLGNITPLEFRETQRKMIDAKSKLVAAQYQAKSAETELLRLSGQLVKSE